MPIKQEIPDYLALGHYAEAVENVNRLKSERNFKARELSRYLLKLDDRNRLVAFEHGEFEKLYFALNEIDKELIAFVNEANTYAPMVKKPLINFSEY